MVTNFINQSTLFQSRITRYSTLEFAFDIDTGSTWALQNALEKSSLVNYNIQSECIIS